MTQTDLDKKAANPFVVLVTLSYGETPTERRYVRHSTDVTLGSDTFTAAPTLAVTLKEQHGGTDDDGAEVTIDAGLAPFDNLSSGEPHARVAVKIEEADPDDAGTRRELFYGWIRTVRVAPSGRSRLATATVEGIKSRLKVAMGVPATTTCAWRFGDARCGVDVAAQREVGTVTALETNGERNRLTVDFGTSTPDLSNSRWRRGYLEVDGLRLMIRKSFNDGRFDLVRIPPARWLNAEVTATPGCDKTISTCRSVWDNEEHFGGLGYAMPARNPIFEVG